MSECYSHHIKLGLQRGAKLGLAGYQTKTPWKNVRTLYVLSTYMSGNCVYHNGKYRGRFNSG